MPFVDNLTTILDPSLPLTVIEWEEWGNPLEDPEVYAYMKSYSPYENVTAQRYPAILAETSLNDTRVLFVEPAKWVAKLRATATDSRGHPAQDEDVGRARRGQRPAQLLAGPGVQPRVDRGPVSHPEKWLRCCPEGNFGRVPYVVVGRRTTAQRSMATRGPGRSPAW